MRSYASLLFTAGLASIASAQDTVSSCITAYGQRSTSSIYTYKTTTTLPVTTVTVNVSLLPSASIVTPSPVTQTSTIVATQTASTTLAQATDTFNSTTTLLQTVTAIITESAVSTIVATVTETATGDGGSNDGTSTVPTPSGFVPVASQLVAAGDTFSKQKAKKRNALAFARPGPNADAQRNYGNPYGGPYQYGRTTTTTTTQTQFPTRVSCGYTVQQTSTVTVTGTATSGAVITAAPVTSTVSVTSMVTVTQTVAPSDASTTIIATETSIITLSSTTTAISTTTLTSTTTFTSSSSAISPTATVYAACAASNIVSFVNDAPIIAVGPSYDYNTTTAASALDCCVQCQTASGSCAGSAFNGGDCYLLVLATSTCNPTADAGNFQSSPGNDPSFAWAVSNGPCGVLTYGGES